MAALRLRAGRGKSGLHGGTVPGNARRGRPQGQCHRKYTAKPVRFTGRAARVKRCGKSAPRSRQRRRQGKPHREQDQVGAAGTGSNPRCRADLRAAVRVGRTRRLATGVLEEWPSPLSKALGRLGAVQNPAYAPSGAARRAENPRGLDKSRSHRGRLSGSIGDKCAFLGTTLWIGTWRVAARPRRGKFERVW